MKRHRSLLARSAATALVAVGLISTAAAQSTIDIGLVQPLTGAFAAAGTDVVNGANKFRIRQGGERVLDMISRAGGMKYPGRRIAPSRPPPISKASDAQRCRRPCSTAAFLASCSNRPVSRPRARAVAVDPRPNPAITSENVMSP